MGVSWTKVFGSGDNGNILYGQQVGQIQDDIDSWVDSQSSEVTRVKGTFTDGDLSSGELTIVHNLNEQFVIVQIYDNNYEQVLPDSLTLNSVNAVKADFSSYGTLSGTWYYVVI